MEIYSKDTDKLNQTWFCIPNLFQAVSFAAPKFRATITKEQTPD